MGDLPEFKGDKILLRKPREEDIEARVLFGSQIEYVRMCGGDTKDLGEFALNDGVEWYNKISAHPCKWVIDYDGACIGEAGLTPYKQDNKARYSIGIFDRTKFGLGIGTEVTKLILRYAFETLGYHKVYLRVLEYNKRAIRCYEKCGFVREGIDREGAFIEGKYETDINMGILADEYHRLSV